MIQKMTTGLLLLLSACAVAGCSGPKTPEKKVEPQSQNSHQQDPASIPKTFVEAVTQISSLNQKIKTALAADDTDTADGPVHQLGHILEDVNDMAFEEGLAEADLNQVKKAVETLFKSFAEVDERIHTGSGTKYSEVEKEISEAVKTLEDKAALVSSKKESTKEADQK